MMRGLIYLDRDDNMKARLEYNYYMNNKKYDRNTLTTMVGSSSFYKHIKDFEKHPNKYTNIIKTSYGYDYTFTQGLFAGDTINIHIKKVTKQHINVDSIFYALDIETSTFYNDKDVDWMYEVKNGKRNIKRINNTTPVSFPYLCGVRGYELFEMLDSPISSGYINNMFDESNYEGYIPLRTYQDIIQWLQSIIDEAHNNNTVKFIVIQNNSYEHSFLHSNVYCKLQKPYKYECSYMSSHKPMKIELFKNNDLCVRILDTYILTGKSIGSYGNTYGYPKFDKSDNYNSIYTPIDTLPQDELIYNKRDLDISALMFCNVIKDITTSCNKTVSEVLPSIYTKTGITRYKNKTLFENKKDNIYYNKHDMNKGVLNEELKCFSDTTGNTQNIKRYEFNHNCFIGGYVRANEKTVYKIQEKVKSIDITSSYPYSMKSKIYGYEYIEPDDTFNKLDFITQWYERGDKLLHNFNKLKYYYFNNHLMLYMSKNMPFWNASIIIKNIKPKPLINNNSMAIMSSSKIINTTNAIINNGRIITADSIALNVSSVELFNYMLIYDFSIVDVAYFEYATKVGKLPKSMHNVIDYYYQRKSQLKELCIAYNNNNILDVVSNINNIALNEYEIKYIQDHYNDNEIVIWLNQLLMNSKADLNAQYGINVEKPNHDEIICTDNNIYTCINNDVEQSILRRNYKVGMLITAWSRMHLILMSLTLIANGAVIHYWDTDSIKFTSNNNYIEDCITLFNKQVGKLKNCDYIGTYTLEYLKNCNYSYEYFISGGSKNYWYMNNNHIGFTVSGLTSKASNIVNDYYNTHCKSFKDFVISVLQPMTDFDGEYIKTSLTDYTSNNKEVECIINGYRFKGFSGVIINQPQSRGLLPHPSRYIEQRFYNEYGIKPTPQLLTMDNNTPIILQIYESNSKELKGLK